ncbi:hypothetical protein Tco_0804716 [Tanacetum coccineum]|uniref:Uncharacterized protein n=1 Tax=Tanacetum coccineum TaxID=301880 RepID=A0ABQ5A9F3_9ASTR
MKKTVIRNNADLAKGYVREEVLISIESFAQLARLDWLSGFVTFVAHKTKVYQSKESSIWTETSPECLLFQMTDHAVALIRKCTSGGLQFIVKVILVQKCLMPLALKTQNDSLAFIHELKQEMHADLKYVESLEDELESDKAEFSNMYDMLLQECVSKDASDLDEITELQCLYLHKVMECDCLAQKLSEQTDFVSKEIYTKLLQRFARLEKHSISLEIALQECQVQLKNDTVCKERASNVFRKEREQYVEIQDLKAQMQDKNMATCATVYLYV